MKNYPITIACLLLVLFCTTGQAKDKDIVGFLIPSSGLGDQSFNDMTYAGLIEARSRHNFTLIREQCFDFTDKSRQNGLDLLIMKGARIIVVNGWKYRNLIETYAGRYPQRLFLINDFPMPAMTRRNSSAGQQESFTAVTRHTRRSGKALPTC